MYSFKGTESQRNFLVQKAKDSLYREEIKKFIEKTIVVSYTSCLLLTNDSI